MCDILETESSIWQPNNAFSFLLFFLYVGEQPEDDVIQVETR
jgi:hypothetical protein